MYSHKRKKITKTWSDNDKNTSNSDDYINKNKDTKSPKPPPLSEPPQPPL